MTKNPYIEPEDYFAAYQKSIDKNKDNPDALSLDKLCYLVFTQSEHGKKLMEIFDERFLLPGLVTPGTDNYASLVTYFEGFKQAFRMMKDCVKSHEQRIKADKQ